eukprot:sb/3468641/
MTVIEDFFLLVKYHKSQLGAGISSFGKFGEGELKLTKSLENCQKTVHSALCDSFDTPAVMRALRSVMSDSYTYLKEQKTPNVRLLIKVGAYVTEILSVFGVINKQETIGFSSGDSSSSTEEAALPFVRVLSQFRDEVRGMAREIKAVSILQSCDNVRDNVLPELGVRLEDREVGEPAVFKAIALTPVPSSCTLRVFERNENRAEKADAKAKAAREKLEKGKVNPMDMFRNDQYSAWDETGLPTVDKEGKPVRF